MSKYKLAVIGVYFGKLPQYFNLWLNSCSYNETIDFFVFTDQKVSKYPKNVKIIKYSLEEMQIDATNVLGFEASLDYAYKCCDYKVIYGNIFKKYIKDYDFWSCCDFDMIFGNIRKYITDDILENYDKILRWGHLSFYRNNDKFNNYYKLSGSTCGNYKEVFTSNKIFGFDELSGIYNIYKSNGGMIYDKILFADISTRYKRFRINDNDYKLEMFYFKDGSIYRDYIKNNKKYTDEFIYVHFQKRKNMKSYVKKLNNFYIYNDGFIDRKDNDNLELIIKKYNKYPGIIYETCENLKAIIKRKVPYYYRRIIDILRGKK